MKDKCNNNELSELPQISWIWIMTCLVKVIFPTDIFHVDIHLAIYQIKH